MPNPLTGDFEAVVQINGRTVNRLLATMHQNDGSGKNLPTFPHHAFIRIGERQLGGPVDNVEGTAWVQLSPPKVELLSGAVDRFILEVWIRARYEPDPASNPLPEFIYGKVRAEFRVDSVQSPFVLGSQRATFLRLQVDPKTLLFTSAGPDTSHDPQISRQLALLFVTRYQPTAHPLLSDFTQQRFRSLVGGGTAAVAHPLNLAGGGLAGNIVSVSRVFLASRDFAVAVSREYIMAQIEPTLAGLRAATRTFSITVKMLWWSRTATYTVTVRTATAQWLAGVIALDIQGEATTPAWWAPNVSFSAAQKLALAFNPATEVLSIAPDGPSSVSVDVNGPLGGLLEPYARSSATNIFNAQLALAVAQVQPKLQGALAQKGQLINQLRTIDDLADAHFDAAEFTPDGAILRGNVKVAPRIMMSVVPKKLRDQTGYTAFRSWIPGGRIEWYTWHWTWAKGPSVPVAPPDGSQTHDDRFILQALAPLPGLPLGDWTPAPGIKAKPVAGRLCLRIKGVRINALTGDDEPVDNSAGPWAERACLYAISEPPAPPVARLPGAPRLLLKLKMTSADPAGADGPESVYVEAGVGRSADEAFNTIVQYLPNESAVESLRVLVEALHQAKRDDAGVLVVLVLPEGLPARTGPEMSAHLSQFAQSVPAALCLAEDVHSAWSHAFGLRGGAVTALRLLSPDGRLAWTHDGHIDATTLGDALAQYLVASAAPDAKPIELGVFMGREAPDFFFQAMPEQWLPLRRLRGHPVLLAFVQPWAASSIAILRRLERVREQLDEQSTVVLAVLDGVDATHVEDLRREHRLTFKLLPDPHGAIAGQYGVRAWPTTVTIDEAGRLAGVDTGADGGALAALARGG